MNVHDLLDRSALRSPNRFAIVARSHHVTYAELEAQSNALANALVRRGVRPGDRVLCLLEPSVEAVVAFFAISKANAIAVMVHPHTTSQRLAFVAAHCTPASLIISAELLPALEAILPLPALRLVVVTSGLRGRWPLEATPLIAWNDALTGESGRLPPRRRRRSGDVATLVYTSLGTSRARGVMFAHRGVARAARTLRQLQSVGADDIVLAALPLSFDYGLYQVLAAIEAGALVVVEKSFAFPDQILTTAIDHGVTIFPAVPTVFLPLAEAARQNTLTVPTVRYVTSTGARTGPWDAAGLIEIFPHAEVHSTFGMVECRCCAHLAPSLRKAKPASVGTACPATELAIVEGELVVRSDAALIGYWNHPRVTEDGLLRTGTRCEMDEDGSLFLADRDEEIERLLHGIPGIKEVAVIGRVKKTFVAFEQESAVTATQLAGIRQMTTDRIEIWRALPKNLHGKVDKALLARTAGL